MLQLTPITLLGKGGSSPQISHLFWSIPNSSSVSLSAVCTRDGSEDSDSPPGKL